MYYVKIFVEFAKEQNWNHVLGVNLGRHIPEFVLFWGSLSSNKIYLIDAILSIHSVYLLKKKYLPILSPLVLIFTTAPQISSEFSNASPIRHRSCNGTKTSSQIPELYKLVVETYDI